MPKNGSMPLTARMVVLDKDVAYSSIQSALEQSGYVASEMSISIAATLCAVTRSPIGDGIRALRATGAATRRKKIKPLSRPQRWAKAASEAETAVGTLVEIQAEFQEWRDNLPDTLDGSSLAEKLDTICELDLDGAHDTLSEASSAEVPLGFGRD